MDKDNRKDFVSGGWLEEVVNGGVPSPHFCFLPCRGRRFRTKKQSLDLSLSVLGIKNQDDARRVTNPVKESQPAILGELVIGARHRLGVCPLQPNAV
jgi:hypothetical protein